MRKRDGGCRGCRGVGVRSAVGTRFHDCPGGQKRKEIMACTGNWLQRGGWGVEVGEESNLVEVNSRRGGRRSRWIVGGRLSRAKPEPPKPGQRRAGHAARSTHPSSTYLPPLSKPISIVRRTSASTTRTGVLPSTKYPTTSVLGPEGPTFTWQQGH